MLLHDRYDITEFNRRNKIADDIMKVIFDAEEIKKRENHFKLIYDRFEILDL